MSIINQNMNYEEITNAEKVFRKVGILSKVKSKQTRYYNVACSFDIETTSFYRGNEKVAIMYIWTFCIDGEIIIGRSWKEFVQLCELISKWYELDEDTHMIIYVHNLPFEFQFMRNILNWTKVFSLEERKPVKCITDYGIEFRCSYALSGYSLANLSSQLNKYKVNKLVGDLDYSLLRNSKTKMTEKEIQYCINDCLVVVAYIKEKIEIDGGIHKIPLTKTGYVRNYCRNNCLYKTTNKKWDKEKYRQYREYMDSMLLDVETYEQLKRAFAGGFTHANPLYSGDIIHNVKSYDFTSSYPYVIVSEEFPMSSPKKVIIKSKSEFEDNINKYCCLFDITFYNIESKELFESYISKSHCWNIKNPIENNGRIVQSSELSITLTEQDYFIIRKLYKWEKAEIYNFKRFKKNYLPKDFVMSVLQLYKDKTELKGIPEREIDYIQAKERINACYGMMVTDICRDEIIYDEEWNKEEVDIDDAIEKYNKNKKRFLYYPWGVWVTAYARRNLFTAILEFKDDYIYSDTDSVKVRNYEKHIEYINDYNNYVRYKLKKAMNYQGIDIEYTKPKNIKGIEMEIGIWSDEGIYKRFKTLGAKRYMVENSNGDISITVSGLNKKVVVPYLLDKYGRENIFNEFKNELKIPAEYTGKMTHTYIDYEISGSLTDYQGNTAYYDEKSSVHLENASYSMSLSDIYINYLMGIRERNV